MKTISLKQTGQLFWAAAALSLMVAQPLWANESPTAPDIQEESIFQSIKRKANEWLGREQNAQKDEKEVAPQTDKPSQKNSAGNRTGARSSTPLKRECRKPPITFPSPSTAIRKPSKRNSTNCSAASKFFPGHGLLHLQNCNSKISNIVRQRHQPLNLF